MNIPNQATEQEDKTKPLWRYVLKEKLLVVEII